MREYEKFHLPQAVGLSSPHLGSKQSVLSMLGQGIDLEKEPKTYLVPQAHSHVRHLAGLPFRLHPVSYCLIKGALACYQHMFLSRSIVLPICTQKLHLCLIQPLQGTSVPNPPLCKTIELEHSHQCLTCSHTNL
jgi:hypothetical protein